MAIKEGLFQRIRAIQRAFTFEWPNHPQFFGAGDIAQIACHNGYLYGFYEEDDTFDIGAVRFPLNSGEADTGSVEDLGIKDNEPYNGYALFDGELILFYDEFDSGVGETRMFADRHDRLDNAALSTIQFPNPDGATGDNNHVIIAAAEYNGDLVALWLPDGGGATNYYVVTYSGFSGTEVSKFTISESNFAPDDMTIDVDNGNLITLENDNTISLHKVRIHDGISATVTDTFDAEGDSVGAYDANFSRLVTTVNRTGYVHNGVTEYDGPAP